jgi:hypothetical protein
MRTHRLPGFTAAAALGAPRGSYRPAGAPEFPKAYGQAILPQQTPDTDPHLAWRRDPVLESEDGAVTIMCLPCERGPGRRTRRRCCEQEWGTEGWWCYFEKCRRTR